MSKFVFLLACFLFMSCNISSSTDSKVFLFFTINESQVPKVLFVGDTATIPISFEYSGISSEINIISSHGKIENDSLLVLQVQENINEITLTITSPEALEDTVVFPINTFSHKALKEGTTWDYCKESEFMSIFDHYCDSTYLTITVEEVNDSNIPSAIFNLKYKVVSYSGHSNIPDTMYEITESNVEIVVSDLYSNIWDTQFWSKDSNFLPLLIRTNIIQPCSYLSPDTNEISIGEYYKKIDIDSITIFSSSLWKYTFIDYWYSGGNKKEVIPGIGLIYWSNEEYGNGGDISLHKTWKLLSHNGNAINL